MDDSTIKTLKRLDQEQRLAALMAKARRRRKLGIGPAVVRPARVEVVKPKEPEVFRAPWVAILVGLALGMLGLWWLETGVMIANGR